MDRADPRGPGHRATRAALLLLATTAATAACGRARRPGGPPAPDWSLSVDWRFGDANVPLAHVFQVAVGPGGVIAEADGPPERVLLVRPDGSAVRIGSRGQGPGEYLDVSGLGFAGDTLWLTDARQSRALLFDSAGGLLRSASVPRAPGGSNGTPPGPIRRLPDGSWLESQPGLCITCVALDITAVRPYVRVAGGAARDTIFLQPLPRSDFFDVRVRSGGIEGIGPIASRPLLVADRGAPGFWIVDRGIPPDGDSAPVQLRRVDLAGDTVLSVSLPYRPIPVTTGWKDRWYAGQGTSLKGAFGATRAQVETAFRAAVTFPAFFPPITDARSGTDGRLWLRERRLDDSASDWLAVDSAGRAEGRLHAPPGFRLLAADSSHVWGVVKDSLDVETIVRARIRAGRAPAGG